MPSLQQYPSPEEINAAREALQGVPPETLVGFNVNSATDRQVVDKYNELISMGSLPNPVARLRPDQRRAVEGLATSLKEQSDMAQDAKDMATPGSMIGQASIKAFNLKKHAQTQQDFQEMFEANPEDPFMSDPGGLEQEQQYNEGAELEEMGAPPFGQPQMSFESPEDLASYLSQFTSVNDVRAAAPEILDALSSSESATDALKAWFETGNEERKSTLQQMIYHGLPEAMRNRQPGDIGVQNVPVTETQFGDTVASYLAGINTEIQKIAKEAVSKKMSKVFNLKKVAQHQTVNRTIMWGPSQMRPDPFLRGQPVSDWHILERNKGVGQDIDGYWGVDWETIWRGTIMDKYSRPYRDTKTGKWIGGYIEKRFEVDKNIPETNNLQLLPGERRRPILPEYGLTEARLQSMRNKDDGHLGRVFNNTEKPFNWHEAQSLGMSKQAQATTGNEAFLSQFRSRQQDPAETMDPAMPEDPEADTAVDRALNEILGLEGSPAGRQELGQWQSDFDETEKSSNPLEKARRLLSKGIDPSEVPEADVANAMRLIQLTDKPGPTSPATRPLGMVASDNTSEVLTAKKKMTQPIKR